MILGALLDAGLSEADLKSHLSGLRLPGFDLRSQRVVKQGFGAVKVDVIVDVDVMVKILFAETSTLGVRRQRMERLSLARSMETVQTPYGPVRVKIGR